MPNVLCKYHFRRGSTQSQCRNKGCAFLHPETPTFLPNKFWCPLDHEGGVCKDPFCYLYHSKVSVTDLRQTIKKRKLDDQDHPSGTKSSSTVSKLKEFFKKKRKTESNSAYDHEEKRVVRQIELPKDEVSDSFKDLEKSLNECKAKLQEYEGIEKERDDLDEEIINFIDEFEKYNDGLLQERTLKGVNEAFKKERAKMAQITSLSEKIDALEEMRKLDQSRIKILEMDKSEIMTEKLQKEGIENERDLMDSEKIDFCKSIYNLLRIEDEKRHYDLQDIYNHVEDLNRNLCSLQSIVNDNELKVKDLHKTLKDKETRIDVQATAMKTISSTIESQSKDLNILQEKNKVLNTELNLKIKEREDLFKDLNQKKEHIENLEHLITVHRSKSEEKDQEKTLKITSLSGKIDALEEMRKLDQSRIKVLEMDKSEIMKEKLNLTKENEGLKKEMGKSDEKICHLKKSLQIINKKSENDKAEFERNLKELKELHDNLEFVHEKLEEESKAKIDALTDDIIASDLEKGHLHDQVNNLTKEKDDQQLSILARDQIINAKIEELKLMEQERDSLDEKLEENNQELSKVHESQRILEKTNRDLKGDLSKLSAVIEKQKYSFQTEISQLEKFILNLKEEIQRKNTQNLVLVRKILPVAQNLENKKSVTTSENDNP